MTVDTGLARFNALPDAVSPLTACCAAPGWAARMAGQRPYADRPALVRAAEQALTALDWAGVAAALAAHPRIGQVPSGGSAEAAWSRQEQQTAGDADPAEMAAANAAYEARFGHVFLICANGRSASELRAELQRRTGNDPRAERAEVRTELAGIVRLRIGKLLTELGVTTNGEVTG